MKNSPLLVIDLQTAFTKSVSDAFIQNITGFIGGWPEELTYWLKFLNHPDSLYEKHIDYQDCTLSADSALIVPPPSHAAEKRKIVNHFGYAPPQDFIAQLKSDGHNSVNICGLDTDACVMAACFSLWDAGIQPIVHTEYCQSSGGTEMHRAALSMMYRQFGMHSMR